MYYDQITAGLCFSRYHETVIKFIMTFLQSLKWVSVLVVKNLKKKEKQEVTFSEKNNFAIFKVQKVSEVTRLWLLNVFWSTICLQSSRQFCLRYHKWIILSQISRTDAIYHSKLRRKDVHSKLELSTERLVGFRR